LVHIILTYTNIYFFDKKILAHFDFMNYWSKKVKLFVSIGKNQ